MGEFDDLIEEFVTESREHIADIEEDLIKIESDMENIDTEVINRVFRAAHSIKGSAKFLDLINIGDLAHIMEDVLNLIRSGKLIPSSEIANPLLQAADMLKNMFEDVMSSNDMDISEHVAALKKILDSGGSAPASKKDKSRGGDKTDIFSVFNIGKDDLARKLEIGQVYMLDVNMKKAKLDAFIEELDNLGETLGVHHSQAGDSSILFTTIMEPDMVPMALSIDSSHVTQVTADMIKTSAQAAPGTKQQTREDMQTAKTTKKAPRQTEQVVAGQADTSEESLDRNKKIQWIKENEEERKPENTSFITFSLDNETYAVPIQAIEEIIGLQDISLLPNVPDFIKGVINLRGDLVPIMDLRLKLGLEEKEYTPFTVFLIVRVEERVMGMVVDNVADVLVIDPKRVQQTPAFSTKISTNFIEGVYKDPQGQMVILMDIPSLINPEEWETSGYTFMSALM